MTLKPALHILTANDLLSGEVVYLTKSGAWSPRHASANIFVEGSLAAKRLAEIERSDISVVGPYLAVVKTSGTQPVAPEHFREVFRAAGPSNRFIGKQTHV